MPSPTQPCGLGPPSPALRERGFDSQRFQPLSRTAGEDAFPRAGVRGKAGEGRRDKHAVSLFPRTASLLLALLLLLDGTSKASAREELAEFAFSPYPGAQLPLAAQLVDEHGRMVPLARFFAGKPVILVFDYLRCKTLCGLTLENLASGLATLPLEAGRDFQVVVISIDPRDHPADLAAAKARYLAAYSHPAGADGWHFLTGAQPVVQSLADTVGFHYRYEPELDQYIHPAGFIVAAPDGRTSRYMLGLPTDAEDLRTALADAANGQTIGLVTRLLLLCHADTAQLGRYNRAIEGAFVAANLMTIIGGIVVFLAIHRRRHG
jgi:protein SCO1